MQILINSPQINSFKFCFCSDAPASQGLRFASVYFGLAFHWISNYHPHHSLQCKLNNDGTVVVGVEMRTDEDKVHKPQMFVEVDLVVDEGEWVQKEECLFWGMRLQNHYHFYPVVVHRLVLS